MTVAWISLVARWKLQDVQAGVNVIICSLSALGIFIFARLCWQAATAPVAKNQDVSLSSLFSVNTLGEAIDVLVLLKFKILSAQYFRILAQCIVVGCLTTTAFLSGPIARFSTRRGYITSLEDVTGSLATGFENMMYGNVVWNQTEASLDAAGFPLNQLLDFLPDTSTSWIYQADQWNSTWSMDCKTTNKTSVTLTVTDNCSSIYSEIPGMQEILPNNFDAFNYNWGSFTLNSSFTKEALLFIIGVNWNHGPNKPYNPEAMDVSLAAVHLHHLQEQQNSSSSCDFGVGDVDAAAFTRMDCTLTRLKNISDTNNIAYPNVDSDSLSSIVAAYNQYYYYRFNLEATADTQITMITPEELIRFYQTYLITTDTQYRHAVTRKMNVQVQIVQLSGAFLAAGILVALLCLLGIAKYWYFHLKYRHALGSTPQTKLDWMLQSVQRSESDLPSRQKSLRRSVQILKGHELNNLPRTERKKVEFQGAKYGMETEPWRIADDNRPASLYGGGGDISIRSESRLTETSEINATLLGKAPAWSIDVGEDDYYTRAQRL